MSDSKPYTLHLLRTKQYNTCYSLLLSELNRRGTSDLSNLYLKSLSSALSLNLPLSIRETTLLLKKRDLTLPALLLLQDIHAKTDKPDYSEIEKIEQQIRDVYEQNYVSEIGNYLAAIFYYFTNKKSEAKEYVEKCLPQNGKAMSPQQIESVSLNMWIELMPSDSSLGHLDVSSDNQGRGEALGLLNGSDSRDLDTLLAKSKYYAVMGQSSKSLDSLNESIAIAPTFLPALLEKAYVFLDLNEYEQAIEMSQRLINAQAEADVQSSWDFDTIMTKTLCDLVYTGRNVVEGVKSTIDVLEREEEGNAVLFYEVSRVFCRLCGRSSSVLNACIKMMKAACIFAPKSATFRNELAYTHRLLGSYGLALDTYRDASSINQGDTTCLEGMIYCQIFQGLASDAEQQLEFLSATQAEERKETLFLQGLLAIRKDDKDDKKHVELLNLTVQAYETDYRLNPRGNVLEDYYYFNPDFQVEIAKEFLTHMDLSTSNSSDSASVPDTIQKGFDILDRVTSRVPALLDAHLTSAKARFSMKQYDKSLATLTHCISINPSHSQTFLLLAQLHLSKGDHANANNSLEQALSYDFKIRSSPVYQLVKSECLALLGDLDGARKQLEDAISIPGVRDGLSSLVTLSDRVSIFCQLASIYRRLNMLSEASSILAEGKSAFEGSAEQIRILVGQSDLAIKKNDFSTAINLLTSVPIESQLYVSACVAKADIYLKHKHDKAAFASCYVDLVNSQKSAATYLLLGEAYMRIQSPELAIDSYESALRYNPKDSRLAEKIGKALVSTHDYRKAQDYYENALRNNSGDIRLRFDLATLYTKLRMYDLAAKVLKKALVSGGVNESEYEESKSGESRSDKRLGSIDPNLLSQDVEVLMLLVEVHKGSKDRKSQKETLLRARTIQKIVKEKGGSSSSQEGGKSAQKRTAADISYALGQVLESEHDDGRAESYYKEALNFLGVHEPSMLALSKLYLRKGQLEECLTQTNTLLRVGGRVTAASGKAPISQANEEAQMIMGDLQFLKSNHAEAMASYAALLDRNPNNYNALEKLISLLRRAGKLTEVAPLFEKASKANPRSASHAGLSYCKGIYYRFSNDITEAAKHFNLSRRDGTWGRKSLEGMIDVYLNPDNSNIWEDDDEKKENGGNNNGMGESKPLVENGESVRVAEKLLAELETLGELAGTGKTAKHKTLENYYLLQTRQKINLDKAMASFIEVLENDKDNLPALLGISLAFLFEKSANKARNYLKRIAKMPYDPNYGEEFERSWLMLAGIYVTRGKFDLAQELCRKCLSFNKSCSGAWELMGGVMEKEQSYKDAADCYEKAWTLTSEAGAGVGFKLAFNYLKANRYTEAIDVCNGVLGKYPDYPRIRKEVLERAMEGLRP